MTQFRPASEGVERELDRLAFQMEVPGVNSDQLRELLTPPPAPAGFIWEPDVPYGEIKATGRTLTLHLYRASPGADRPAIIFVHGGGFIAGHPYLLARHAYALALEGYVTATISYRLSTEARWPGAIEDAKCAMRWMRVHAREVGVDTDRIAVVGGSAGGYLAAMVALTPGEYEGEGGWPGTPSNAQAAVLYNPGLDLAALLSGEPSRDLIGKFLGSLDPHLLAQTSAIRYVSASAPPILTRIGELDEAVPLSSCEAFHEKLDDCGVFNRLEVVPGARHGITISDYEGCIRATLQFLDEAM